MTDLEQLKQQLHAKIQATSNPEPPPSDLDLVKYSQLPTCQAHQNLRKQTEQQWQQAPMQGAIPPQPTDWQCEALADDLYSALEILSQCHEAAIKRGLKETRSGLYTAIADAYNSTQEAIQRVADALDY